MTRGTVRMRATALALGGVGAALIVAAVALVVLLHHALVSDVDAQARLRLDAVAALVLRGQVPATLVGGDDDGTVAQVMAGGRVVSQSPLIQGAAPLEPFVPADEQVTVRTVKRPRISGGAAYRIAAQRLETADGPVLVYAAASLEPVTESTGVLRVLLAVAVPLLLVFVGVTTWSLVGRALEPVEAIRRQVAEISVTALDRRVPVPATADEIERLARTMNQMLARLDAAARRQRSFVADASHELHSPLATIRAKLEVGLGHPEGVDWPGLAGGWLDEQTRLERLVENLLVLAQTDDGAAIRSPAVVDLDELMLRELRDLRARGRVRIDVSGVLGGRVLGDADQLHRVVRNLLDNAERHAATSVRVELAQADPATVVLAVSDDGPGIAAGQRERVFERFVRLDEARNRDAGGAGLGLAIVREIVTGHGGTAVAEETETGARLVIRLPAAERGSPSPVPGPSRSPAPGPAS